MGNTPSSQHATRHRHSSLTDTGITSHPRSAALPPQHEVRAEEMAAQAANPPTYPPSRPHDPGSGKHRGNIAINIENASKSSGGSGSAPLSPRRDAQLGGYPPDCGTKEYKYLSYAKVMHDRAQTHPMSYSTTEVDPLNRPKPVHYPVLQTDFGAHAFHRLPTDSVVLSPYGIGMTLYFRYLKVMAWLFLLLVLLSTPSLVIFIIGGTGSLQEFQQLVKQNLPMVLGMTSIGHLQESTSACDQVVHGQDLSLTCAAGEIGFVKAVYSSQEIQGSCSCPENNKVAEGSGRCRGIPVDSCSTLTTHDSTDCISECPKDGYGCFLGIHPVSQWPCCSYDLDPNTNKSSFEDMRIHETPRCHSRTIETIVKGLCLGKQSCSFRVSEDEIYSWKVDVTYETFCPHNKSSGTPASGNTITTTTKDQTSALDVTCSAKINDDSDYSRCPGGTPRALIVYARCFTTRIALSNEWSLKIIGWDTISRQDFLGIAVGCDITCSICFFGVVLWMKKKEKKAVERIAKDQIKALDYTVQLVHVPRHKDIDTLRDALREHLETVLTNAPRFAIDVDRIRIADIQFGKSTAGHLDLLRSRGKVVRKLEVAQQRFEKFSLLSGRISSKTFDRQKKRHLRHLARLERKLDQENRYVDRWHRKQKIRCSALAVTAFITFEEEEGFHRCLTEYPDLGYVYRLFQPKYKRLYGKRLHFRPAPDPTDIVWENLHHPYWKRLLRQTLVSLITLAVLLASFVLIYIAKLQKTKLERQFGRPTSCPADVTKSDVLQDEANKISGLVPYKSLVECYCKNVLLTKSFSDMTDEVFVDPLTGKHEFYCQTWATTFITTQALSVASVLMVVFINVLLARILHVLVTMEKHHTESNLVVSHVTKVFAAQFCNTALLLLVINANPNYFTGDDDSDNESTPVLRWSSFQILNGKYSDFSPAWYNDVGVSLMLTMVLNSFSPHIYVLLQYLSMELRRFYDRGWSFDYSLTRQNTQRDLEALYRGPKFDLAARYGQSLTWIFITYMFSAGMPLLHLVGFFAILMTYWADKFTFLRITRSPPLYNSKVAAAGGSLLPYAVLLHCLVAMWMFSNQRIFQSANDVAREMATSDDSPIGDDIPSFADPHGQVFERVIRPNIVVLFAFFLLFCATLILRAVLFDYLPFLLQSCCPILKRLLQKPKLAKGIPNYFDAIPTAILREKLSANQPLRPALREKYERALSKREASGQSSSPRRRNKRAVSAAEQYSHAQWIVGCVSYAINDNKEYVDQLAIDSHLSETIDLQQIF